MNTRKEIKEVENKIKTARSFIDANFDVSKDPDGKNMSDEVVNAFETEMYSEEKLNQLKLKLEKEKNLTKKINALKTLGVNVVSRERNYDESTYNFINGFYPEKICIQLKFGTDIKVVPLNYLHDDFFISYKDHGGQSLFNVMKDKVEDQHLYYRGRA
tara:strand:- start:46 stop:519 length:474 start_codon:yes stop_codon:yes gene_type:complete